MALRPQRILSLCTGYGGLELGLQIAGLDLQPLVYVEREVYAAANLVERMEEQDIPSAPIWDCVDTFDATPLHGVVDGIVGGYPCQPFSIAGRRRGEKDHRHLWPHFARIIRECEPRWCFFENVPNHLNLGFDVVARELQEMGYRIAATLVTAEEVGASHKRERLFILAPTRREPVRIFSEWREQLEAQCRDALVDADCTRPLAYSDSHGLPCERESREILGQDPSWHDVDRCSRSSMANTIGTGQQRSWEGRSRMCDAQVADPDRDEWGREHEPREPRADGWPKPEGSRAELGNTDMLNSWEAELRETSGRGHDEPSIFPPPRDPNDPRWGDWPWPCVEPEIRERPNGHPYWVDELRLNGGGVVPLQAAYAFSLLAAGITGG